MVAWALATVARGRVVAEAKDADRVARV